MWSFLKKIGWRILAAYYWIHLSVWLLGFGVEAIQIERDLTNQFGNLLSSIGAAPVNPIILFIVIKVGWFLFITEFRPLLMIGFFFYLLIFPISATVYIILKLNKVFKWKNFEQSEEIPLNNENNKSSNKRDTVKRNFPFPLLISIGFLLLSWFLIFGNTKSSFFTYIGVFLSGLLFLGFISRLFIRSKPVSNEQPTLFYWIEFPIRFSLSHLEEAKKKKHKNNEAIKSDISSLNILRNIAIRIIVWLRKKTVQNKFSFIVLIEFITSMIVMGTCAILFWALFAKAIAPDSLDILTSLHLSASYFLPGLDKPQLPVTMPNWLGISASVTAWIMFVLYLSPAGNLIPDKQKFYLKQLSLTYKSYKNSVFAIDNQIETLEKELNILRQKNQAKKLLPKGN